MTGQEEERLARVALSRLGEPGDPRLTGLVAELGAVHVRDLLLGESPGGRQGDDRQETEEGSHAQASRTERDRAAVVEDVAARLITLDPEAELARADRRGIRFVVPGDVEWPAGLAALAGAGTAHERGGIPLGLWVRGALRLDQLDPRLAVVGSRSATTYGERVAAEVAAVAARAGYCVVSGAAFGIDQAAHRGALAAGGTTIAVLACGVDRAYPAAHRQLIDHVAEVGAVVSEAPPGCAPMRVRFLARNRVIAALSAGTVVVEAAVRSGALSTATWAERVNRPVMAVPGPVTSAASQGVHERIRLGAATLVTSGYDVLELVGRPGEHLVEVPREPPTARDRVTARHRQVLDALPVSREVGSDAIARASGIGVREAYRALLTLEERGLAVRGTRGWRLGRDAASLPDPGVGAP
ncbi:DNA-processing protein DprA [Nocardioides campestrisoli]|uniref:DNA-processing protein DprA n=1 Tax=Nocardioides campestrisoli TaxID=2736757 RepID=UPI00163DBB9A|nr:DNA-processing protein DprA [Nocardioides campestrisoli]